MIAVHRAIRCGAPDDERTGEPRPQAEGATQAGVPDPATIRLELRITVPGDDQDDLDDALRR
jgi:hypothetical protein